VEAPAAVAALPALTFRYSVDYPQAWSFPAKKILVRGWCLATEADAEVRHLRATVNGRRRVPGVYGLKRLDVFATMRDLPQAEYCGWKVEIPLELGDTELVLEVGDEAGGWHVFFTTPLRVGDDAGPPELTSYERWAATFDTHSPEALKKLAEESRAFAHRPVVSIVVPIYNTPERWLLKVVDSVRAQTYERWELCLADDASPHTHVRPLLERLAAADPRIKVTFREKNGHISAASNSALALATGEFVALLDHDDELAPHALHEIVALLNAQPATDLIYSDEDKIDEEGRRHEPYFKPDWLPDLFTAQNFISHLTTYRTALVREAGGFRVGFEGSQDWDLALRVIEKISDPSRIRHIPKILYHWRAIPGSTALMLSEKNYPLEAARRALTDHFARRGEKVSLHHVPGDHWRVQYPLPAAPPLVSLVIPTRNGLKFLQRCVDSILEKTTYPNYEIIVVDNGSDDEAALAYLKALADGTHPVLAAVVAEAAKTTNGGKLHRAVRVLRYDAPFNFSAINNFAVAQAQGDLVGLLNNDLEVITPAWLEEMAAQALRPGVGCVGAMLYYPNDTIQHAGVIVGLGGVAGHAFRDYPRGTDGKFNRARLVQNYSAVTAACLVVRKSTYTQVGGLDERQLTVAFNDIDFCLKVRAAGFRNLWTPFAELYHHESVSRGAEDTPAKHERFRGEVETMMQRWAGPIRHDPAYNPNLSLEHTDFSLAAPPRPWSATA
jgi:glycosyltransferase involved in cell wall biosynthesis